jgi:hypothetical protein
VALRECESFRKRYRFDVQSGQPVRCNPLAILAVLDGRRPKNMDRTHVITISDKPPAPQPSGTVSWHQILAKLIDYFLSNVIKAVGSVSLVVGGIFFLVYFWSIGFMPEMDAKALVTLLAVSFLTGSFLLLTLGFYLLAPGWWWAWNTRDIEPLKSPGWFFFPMAGVIYSLVLSAFWIPKLPWVFPLLIFLISPLSLLFSRRKILKKLNRKHKLHENLINIDMYIYRPFTTGQIFNSF